MVDGVQLTVKITKKILEAVLNNPMLVEGEIIVDKGTGEVKKYVLFMDSLEIQIKLGKYITLILKGSLNKYYNNGANHIDLSYQNLCNVINKVENDIGIPANQLVLSSLEVGFSLWTSNQPNYYYDDYIMHRGKKPMDINYRYNINQKLKGIQYRHSQIVVKCYDKGSQYQLKKNKIRIEVKALKMQRINRMLGKEKPLLLSDIKNGFILDRLSQMILKAYDDILKIKEVKRDKLRVKDLNLINEGMYVGYWDRLKKQGRHKYDTRLKRYKLLQTRYSADECKHDEIRRSIIRAIAMFLKGLERAKKG